MYADWFTDFLKFAIQITAVPELTLTAPTAIEEGRLMNLSCTAQTEYPVTTIGLTETTRGMHCLLLAHCFYI